MKKVLAATILFGVCAFIAAAQGTGKGSAKIEGSWTGTAGISDGKKIPDDIVTKLMLVVTLNKGKYTVSVQGKEVENGTYKYDPSKKPAHLDIHVLKGKDEGKDQLGILKLEGDVMTVAIANAGNKTRPKNFEGGDGVEVTVMKRNK